MMLLTTTLGEKVVSKASAETLGAVDGVVIDTARRRITALRVGKGRHTKVISWDQVTGVGTAAVIVEHDDALRDPSGGLEERYTDGSVALIGGLVLSDRGNSSGTVADLEYDGTTGAITCLRTSQATTIDADRLRAIGTYAWVVAAQDDEGGAILP
jgi:sporulation protein YlmC with PRC-barrel domain